MNLHKYSLIEGGLVGEGKSSQSVVGKWPLIRPKEPPRRRRLNGREGGRRQWRRRTDNLKPTDGTNRGTKRTTPSSLLLSPTQKRKEKESLTQNGRLLANPSRPFMRSFFSFVVKLRFQRLQTANILVSNPMKSITARYFILLNLTNHKSKDIRS